MASQVGAQAVGSDITNFGAKFNNGQVDIIGAPAAFKPLELHKVWVLRVQLSITQSCRWQATWLFILINSLLVLVKNQENGSKGQLPRAFGILGKMKADIPQKYWMEVPAADKPWLPKADAWSAYQPDCKGHLWQAYDEIAYGNSVVVKMPRTLSVRYRMKTINNPVKVFKHFKL